MFPLKISMRKGFVLKNNRKKSLKRDFVRLPLFLPHIINMLLKTICMSLSRQK